MYDHGKVMQHMLRNNKTLPPSGQPLCWDETSTGREWDRGLEKIGFSSTIVDEARWVFTLDPETSFLGITVIIYFENQKWLMDLCFDMSESRNDAPWAIGLEAPDFLRTPLEVAKWSLEYVQEKLMDAHKRLSVK